MADLSQSDICIIGAGALGIALAQYARRLGASVTLVDRGFDEAGDGPQQAMRVAALQASATRGHAMRSAGAFGIAGVEPKIAMRAVQERATSIVQNLARLSSHDRLSALGIRIIRGATSFADGQTLIVGDTQVRARTFLLATGSKPSVPSITGINRIGFFTADTILENNRKLTHLLVIGDNADAYALAQAHARLGSQVTLVPQGAALAGFDRECVDILLRMLASEGVRVVDGGTVQEIQPRTQGIGAVVTLSSGEQETLDLSHVLVAIGRDPDLAGLELERARLVQQNGTYARGALGQTSTRRIRVVGAAAGIEQWQHALSHGQAVVGGLVGGGARALASQPRLVLTQPGLAEVGTTEASKSANLQLYRENLAENEYALAQGNANGLIKVSATPKGRIVAASVVGSEAAELAAVLTLAMSKSMALSDLASLPLPQSSLMSSLVRLASRHRESVPEISVAQKLRALRRKLPI